MANFNWVFFFFSPTFQLNWLQFFFFQITIKEFLCNSSTGIQQCMNKSHSIIHVIAESDDKRSVIHYLWSIIGSPTIIAAYFEKTDVQLSVNWTEIFTKDSSGGIQFTPQSDYITAFVIPSIYEFQDPKDELFYTEKDIEQSRDIVKHTLEKALWKNPEINSKNNLTTFKSSMLGGTVIFQVKCKLFLILLSQHMLCLPPTHVASIQTLF